MTVVHISEVLPELERTALRAPTRWLVVRTGERHRILSMVRLAVYLRDDFRCGRCGWRDPSAATLQLDHGVPWSAGGSDYSHNLRVLCGPCNRRRSNYDDGGHLRRRLPVTWWCEECWAVPSPRPLWRDGTDLSGAPPVAHAALLAFCAWCCDITWTDRLASSWTPSSAVEKNA